jgi:outer membrane lipoprotein-sorting protein
MIDDTELQEMFRRLVRAVPEDPSLIDSVMRRIEQSPSLPTPRRTSSWVMRHPLFRVAAAAIFVLATVVVALLFHGGGTTPAFADFIEPILKAKTVKFKATTEMKGPSPVTTTGEMMVLDATRSRWEMEMPDKSKVVTIQDLSQGKQLTLMADSKTATILTFAPRDRTSADGDLLAGLRSLLLDARQKPDVKREPLGEKDIDGRRVIGFRITIEGADVNLWGDPKTGQPVCLEMTAGMDGSMKGTASDFVFNADMDESLFSVEPPAGYTVRYEKSDASRREEDLIAMFREYSRLTGTLPDSLDERAVFQIVWRWGNAEIQWEREAPSLGKVTEEQKHRYMEISGTKNFVKEMQQLRFEIDWDNIAPENVRANEEQKHEFVELMLKAANGKLNNEQFEQEIRAIWGDQMLKAMDARIMKENEARKAAAAPTPQSAREEEARTRKFTESQQRVQRGVQFAGRLSPTTDAHYVGKGVSPGASDKPIFWYRPHDSEKYRVIYADFSVRESDAAPSVPNSQPEPSPDSPK